MYATNISFCADGTTYCLTIPPQNLAPKRFVSVQKVQIYWYTSYLWRNELYVLYFLFQFIITKLIFITILYNCTYVYIFLNIYHKLRIVLPLSVGEKMLSVFQMDYYRVKFNTYPSLTFYRTLHNQNSTMVWEHFFAFWDSRTLISFNHEQMSLA